jgi:serine/threonine protein phosphatase PrpC
MEDACAIAGEFSGPGTQLYGVFDGHAGNACALHCAQTLPETISKHYSESQDMAAAIVAAISEVNAFAIEKWPYLGCTLAVAIIANNTVYFANVGDTRIVLIENGIARRISVDHHISNPEERQAILDRGGHIVNNRVNNSLALTRAIGDGCLADTITGEPHTDSVTLDETLKLIIACDGVWDVMNEDEAGNLFVQAEDPGTAAKLIKDMAIERGTSDNVTVLCVSCKPKE